MKRLWVGVALTLVAHAAFAAVQYEYIQTHHSDSDGGMPPMNMSAKAVIDGARSRIEFISGNAYPPGTYVVSTDGARKLQFVDPTQKTYTEVNTLTIASAIGMSNIKVENLTSAVTRLDDQQLVAGIPTNHYRLTLTFDVTVMFSGRPLKQSFRTEIDKWTTSRYSDVADAFSARTLQTGNPQIDELIAAETGKISGFPLKQTVRITAINAHIGKNTGRSQLKVPATTTITREMTVTSIRETSADATLFDVPAGYKRADFAERIPKAQTQVLSLEPSGD